MKLLIFALPILFFACASPSPTFESTDHDFATQTLKKAEPKVRIEIAAQRPNLSLLLERAKKRFAPSAELNGLIDSEVQSALKAAPWRDHPQIQSQREVLKASLTEYDQARELEDLLDSYRALRNPDKIEKPVISPNLESLRGTMADLSARSAWQELRRMILARATGIFTAQAALTFSESKVSITKDHLRLVDEMIPIVRARTGTGSNRQADLLAIRSERAMVAARLEAYKAQQKAAVHTLKEAANTKVDLRFSIPALAGSLVNENELRSTALTFSPILLSMRAKLERRRSGLRLAELAASDSAHLPGTSVRAAIRRQMRDRIDSLAKQIDAFELSLGTEVAQIRSRIVGARSEVQALSSQALPDAHQALSDLLSSYSGRRASFLDVFRAARRRLAIELDLARAVHDRTRAEAALFRTIGRRNK